jgi:hypothetical protein
VDGGYNFLLKAALGADLVGIDQAGRLSFDFRSGALNRSLPLQMCPPDALELECVAGDCKLVRYRSTTSSIDKPTARSYQTGFPLRRAAQASEGLPSG